ncbi:phosphoglycerate mutase [Thermincola ferriacetica]|uniref:Alpha-ribazole phosphatase n=1 Tax=Thermincola ferriacetica TaxID=281456 RepID=A0A0L6W6U5_9FIRM|nr:alpha-ribazole phosphatase [Thermincola ferriacetica]KNZ71191.1 phosphoglycerate mutase [Thermincola ferriacetica]
MDDMVRIYLVRHGETNWNKSLKYQGHKDVPLNDEGKKQAEKIGLRLAKEKIDAVYSSDLSRARETAAAIARHHNKQVITLREFRETNFGCWEGLTYVEIVAAYEEVMLNWRKNPWQTKIPGGECLEEVVNRTNGMFWQLVEKHAGENIVIVAHGGTNRTIIAGILGMDFNDYWKLKQDNVCLNIIEVFPEKRAILCALNDTSHLF